MDDLTLMWTVFWTIVSWVADILRNTIHITQFRSETAQFPKHWFQHPSGPIDIIYRLLQNGQEHREVANSNSD